MPVWVACSRRSRDNDKVRLYRRADDRHDGDVGDLLGLAEWATAAPCCGTGRLSRSAAWTGVGADAGPAGDAVGGEASCPLVGMIWFWRVMCWSRFVASWKGATAVETMRRKRKALVP